MWSTTENIKTLTDCYSNSDNAMFWFWIIYFLLMLCFVGKKQVHVTVYETSKFWSHHPVIRQFRYIFSFNWTVHAAEQNCTKAPFCIWRNMQTAHCTMQNIITSWGWHTTICKYNALVSQFTLPIQYRGQRTDKPDICLLGLNWPTG